MFAQRGASILEVAVGDRDAWKSPDHPLRLDPKIRLTRIPTLVSWEMEGRRKRKWLVDGKVFDEEERGSSYTQPERRPECLTSDHCQIAVDCLSTPLSKVRWKASIAANKSVGGMGEPAENDEGRLEAAQSYEEARRVVQAFVATTDKIHNTVPPSK